MASIWTTVGAAAPTPETSGATSSTVLPRPFLSQSRKPSFTPAILSRVPDDAHGRGAAGTDWFTRVKLWVPRSSRRTTLLTSPAPAAVWEEARP